MTPSPIGEARYGLELAGLLRSPTFLRAGQALDPEPVLLVPGFLAGDGSLQLLGSWLRRRGHRVCTAAMWANVDCSGEAADRLEARLERFSERCGARVVIIGQSRGGTLGRALGSRRPDLVSRVVMLGSPIRDQMAINPFVRVALSITAILGTLGVPGLLSAGCLDGECCAEVHEELNRDLDPGVRAVAIYSRSDGVVDWRSCLDPHATDLVEIGASHCGMAVSRAAWRAVAEALESFRDADERRRPARRAQVHRLPRAA
jgi:pimeloyl-ACP methyl ester carboxylesterase